MRRASCKHNKKGTAPLSTGRVRNVFICRGPERFAAIYKPRVFSFPDKPCTVDLASVNFDTAEDVTDIEPEPTIAISENEHHFASIGYEAKRQLLMLLDETDPEEPLSTRVFERLGGALPACFVAGLRSLLGR